jgi:putative phosphoserine phosphatase/1-acylglycerol-3-phosphate O-acyltransferase
MIAALFDFDGTLYTGHIWQDLVRHHRATRRHRRWVVAYVAWNMARVPLYKLGLMSQAVLYRTWGETMAWLLRGWGVGESQALFDRLTAEQILPNLRTDILARLREHQEKGHLVALASGAFAPWLQTIARRLDVPHAIGTPLEVRNGRYTGRIVKPLCQGPDKLARVQAYLAEKGIAVDWAASFAYADGGTDLSLLSQVGHPVAVYPDELLLARATTRGWPVISEAGE